MIHLRRILCPRPFGFALGLALLAAAMPGALASTAVLREPVEEGVTAALQGGRAIFLEVRPPNRREARNFYTRYLANPADANRYRDRLAAAIPYGQLNARTQRRALEALFPQDYVDEAGWWHFVSVEGEEGVESWWAIAEWLTGRGTAYREIMALPENEGLDATLRKGQRLLVPKELLIEEMRRPSPHRAPPIVPADPPPAPVAADAPPPTMVNGELEYGQDGQGPYAAYRLKRGEALYSSVVVRFTDFRDNRDILNACGIIAKRSGIADVHDIDAGHRIIIPREMLSARYQPRDSVERQAYEDSLREARRLQDQRVRTRNLEGVVVVLDPGHGGRDHGASQPQLGLYEDELNYDIACRIKRLLETRTQARVYMTVFDPVQKYEPTNRTRFTHDTHEVLLTTPPYDNTDARVSANLRWYLANSIFRRERARGVDERKIIFASIHCDALFNSKMRGAMVYIPGAAYRRDQEQPMGAVYAQFQEAREQLMVRTTSAERQRDEALSRNFAETFLDSLRTHRPPIKVHDTGDPIRNVIRQSGGRAYVPAVLRNNMIPTKVLIEAANMTNPTDCERLADPRWREWFAEAFVRALEAHFN